MKSSFLGFLTGVSLTTLVAFKAVTFQPNSATAEVVNIDGLYIFTDSRPIMNYDSLGVVELGFVSGTQYESIRSNLIKRARKDYPNANGLILDLNKKGIDKGIAIKFN
ncbi:MAG: hypothetical protein IPJ20_13710 [Flammeovirgaceae bacterium]|nr:hypothetical protein [Flammeovirgaceae bacterium]